MVLLAAVGFDCGEYHAASAYQEQGLPACGVVRNDFSVTDEQILRT
jgi:hypothetical protein